MINKVGQGIGQALLAGGLAGIVLVSAAEADGFISPGTLGKHADIIPGRVANGRITGGIKGNIGGRLGHTVGGYTGKRTSSKTGYCPPFLIIRDSGKPLKDSPFPLGVYVDGPGLPSSVIPREPAPEEILEGLRLQIEQSRERVEGRRVRLAHEKARRDKIRMRQGLMECQFFKEYFEFAGQKCYIQPVNLKSRTVGLYVNFQEKPNLVLAWYDQKAMTQGGNDPRCKSWVENYMDKLEKLREDRNTTLLEIKETGLVGMLNSLQEFQIRLGLSVDNLAFMQEITAKMPYILGPTYRTDSKR